MNTKRNFAGFNPIYISAPGVLPIRVIPVDGSAVTTLSMTRAIDADGSAIFNVGGVVSSCLVDKRKLLHQGPLHGISTNKLFVKFEYGEPSQIAYAHNAAIQSHSLDILDDTIKFLMLKDTYSVYDGFPFGLTAYNPLPSPSGVKGDFSNEFSNDFWNSSVSFEGIKVIVGSMFGVTDEVVGVIDASYDMEYSDIETAMVGDDVIKLVKADLSDTPFYVRWINHIGGYEFKMFQLRQRIEQRVGDIQTIQTNTQQTIGLSATNVVTTGDNELSRIDFEWLRGIALSPDIAYYNKAKGEWLNITILDENTQIWDTDSGVVSVNFNFLMPKIITQF